MAGRKGRQPGNSRPIPLVKKKEPQRHREESEKSSNQQFEPAWILFSVFFFSVSLCLGGSFFFSLCPLWLVFIFQRCTVVAGLRRPYGGLRQVKARSQLGG